MVQEKLYDRFRNDRQAKGFEMNGVAILKFNAKDQYFKRDGGDD